MATSADFSLYSTKKAQYNKTYIEKNKVDHQRHTRLAYWNKQHGKENVECFVKLMGYEEALTMFKNDNIKKKAEIYKAKSDAEDAAKLAKQIALKSAPKATRPWHESQEREDYSATTALAQSMFETMNVARAIKC